MKIMSFALTTDEYRARLKDMTRRTWSENYAKRYHKGDVCWGYDKCPRNGGKPIGVHRLTKDPYKQWLHDMPESDLKREGGRWKTLQEFIALFGGDRQVWVVEFKILEVFVPGNPINRIKVARYYEEVEPLWTQ